MFTVSTKHYLVTVVTKPEVLEHLIPNIKKLDITYFIKQEFKGGRPKDTEEKDVAKVEMLCEWGKLGNVMNYIKEYYVKGYGAVCYYIEVMVPM